MGQIKFGTDGWRAVIAEDFTFHNVARVAQATADHWSATPVENTERKVIVGYDRRFLSDQFAKSAGEIFAANDVEAHTHPCRFICGQSTARSRWRDDHGQP